MDEDFFGRAFKRYQGYKRRTDRSALEALAGLFIGASFIFWAVAFWQLLAPASALSLYTLQVGVLALVFSVAAPLLWSGLVPTTPAGQMLQKAQWRTIGFVAIIAAAVYLSYTAFSLLELWLWAQLQGTAPELVRPIAIALGIAFILIPALAWTQMPYDRMLAQIRQAHEVRRLELMQRGDLAILKNHLLWMESRALMGYANLLPDEQAHVRASIAGLLTGIAQTQRRIARLSGLSNDYDRAIGIPGDDELNSVIGLLTSSLEKPAEEIERSMGAHVDARSASSIPREAERVTPRVAEPTHVNARLEPSIPRVQESGTVRQSQAQSGHVYDAIARDLPVVFTAGDVSERMRWQDKRPAQRVIREWVEQGIAREVRLGRYSLTE